MNFINSNLFEEVTSTYDVIVSNPPYIRKSDMGNLQKEVTREPEKALDGGEDGLYFYKKIIKEAKKYLNEEGYLIFEIGFDQAKEVSELLEKYNYKNIEVIKDLSKNDRVVKAQR